MSPARAARFRDAARSEAIASMYLSGLTLQGIADHYGLSRERIRQIIFKMKIPPKSGGQAKRTERRRATLVAARDARSIARWGCSYAEKAAIPAAVLRAYTYQRRSAQNRGIAWKITLAAWWKCWLDSGQWGNRGRGRWRYCMSRKNDCGGYEIGNVYITTNQVNGREFQRRKRAGKTTSKTVSTGVYELYPGCSSPYLAKVGKVYVGLFADPISAAIARTKHIASRNAAGVAA